MIDILENKILEKKVLDKGIVAIKDCLPRLVPDGSTCDYAIAEAARVSYGEGTKTVSDDRNLIRYLMRHSHSTPTEMVSFKFYIKMPGFVRNQLIRHRTASVNEYSARYSVVKDEFYIPQNIRTQSTTNKQGSEMELTNEDSQTYRNDIENHCKESYDLYEIFLDEDVTREQARMILPNNAYTELYWQMNLHNLLHLLSLRCDSHAQWETRQYADAILELITPLVPWTIQAWNEFNPKRDAVVLTKKEIENLKEYLLYAERRLDESNEIIDSTKWNLNSGNKREDSEWQNKLKKMGLVL